MCFICSSNSRHNLTWSLQNQTIIAEVYYIKKKQNTYVFWEKYILQDS